MFSLVIRGAWEELQKKQTKESKEFMKPVITPSGEDYLETILVLHKKITEQLIAAGVDPETAEVDACRIEHVISNESLHLKDRPPRISIRSEISPENYLFPRSRNCDKMGLS